MPGKALKAGSGCLYSWSGLNFFLSSLILIIVLSGFGDSPLLDMVFEQSAIDRLDADVILAMNGEKPLAQINPEVPVKKVV